jgi:hypothetical protein
MIKIKEDKDFLLAQREKGSRGSMAGLDSTLIKREQRLAEREEIFASRHRRLQASNEEAATTVALSSSTSSSSDMEPKFKAANPAPAEPSTSKRRKTVLTPGLAASLDRTKMSNRKAAVVLVEAAKGLGHNVEDLTLSR